MESQALSPGDGNPGTWQRPHDLPAPRCLSSLLFPSLFFFHFPLLLFCFGFSLSFSPFPARKKIKRFPPLIFGKTKSVRCTKCRRREKKEQDLFMGKRNVFVQGIKRELKRERERESGSSLIARRRKYKSPLFFLLFLFSQLPFVFLLLFLFFWTSRFTFKWLFMRETVDLVHMQQVCWCFTYFKHQILNLHITV